MRKKARKQLASLPETSHTLSNRGDETIVFEEDKHLSPPINEKPVLEKCYDFPG